MKPGQTAASRRARALVLASSPFAMFLATDAAAQTRAAVDVSIGATAATDPFLLDTPDSEAIGVNLTVDPSISFEGDATTVTFQGRLSLDQYLSRYGLDESVNLGLTGNHRFDERTRLSTSSSFSSSRSVTRHRFALGQIDLGGVEPGQFPAQPVIDPTLGSLGGRTNSLDASLSLERLLTPTSALQVGSSVGLVRVGRGFGHDYRDAALRFGYSRRLSERTVALLNTEGNVIDYLGRRASDARLVSLLAGLERQLSNTFRMSGQVGVSSVWMDLPVSGQRQRFSLAAALDLCNQNEWTSLCAFGSHRAQPTAVGGISNVTAFGVSYAQRVSEKGRASLSGSYGRSGESLGLNLPQPNAGSRVIGVAATYAHDVAPRIAGYVTPSFSSVSDRVSGARQNYQVVLGVRFRLGNRR